MINKISGTDAYSKQDFAGLSKELATRSNRIDFEKWLINQFSPDEAIDSDFAWQSKVIELLCTKVREDTSADRREQEDNLIAKLIAQATPLEKKPGALHRIADLVQRSAGMVINPMPIYSAIKSAELPHTCHVLLKRLLGYQELETIFNQAIMDNNISMLKVIRHEYPQEFAKFLPQQDEQGLTCLHRAVIAGNPAMIEAIIDHPVKELKTALLVQDEAGNTPLHWAATRNRDDEMKSLIELSPDAVRVKDNQGNTPLHIAVFMNNIDSALVLIDEAPDLVAMKGSEDITPLHYAVIMDNLDMVNLIQQMAPIEFKTAAEIEDKDGNPPIFSAAIMKNMDILEILKEEAPLCLMKHNKRGETLYSILKKLRPEGYRVITEEYKKDPHFIQWHKICLERVALSHALHIEGLSPVKIAGKKELLFNVELEGHRAPEWFHLMEKDLEPFIEAYPGLLRKEQISLMKHLFNIGANPTSYSKDEICQRIENGLPVLVSSGFVGHEVTVLIWGNRFVICNRGGAKRRAIEVHHFDPKSFNVGVLDKIAQVKSSGKVKDYKKLFYETLPSELKFHQTELDRELEKAGALPAQTVGNCTFTSSATGNYAFISLGTVCGINDDGSLRDPTFEQLKKTYFQRSDKSISNYQTWLSNLQIGFLEKMIAPDEARHKDFEPDHVLILEALRKVQLLPLDDKCRERLDKLTATYCETLSLLQRARLNVDLLYWKTLSKQPLL